MQRSLALSAQQYEVLHRSYERALAGVWSIEAAATYDELLHHFDLAEQAQWFRWMDHLADADDELELEFYDWIATPARLRAVHSTKWAEILTNGVWAASVVAALGARRVIDVGANTGYWTAWLRSTGYDAVGLERSSPLVELGHAIASEKSVDLVLEAGDYRSTALTAPCVVSIQTMLVSFKTDDFSPLADLSRIVEDGGHAVLVEGGITDRDAARGSLRQHTTTPSRFARCTGSVGLASKRHRSTTSVPCCSRTAAEEVASNLGTTLQERLLSGVYVSTAKGCRTRLDSYEQRGAFDDAARSLRLAHRG